jgi:hypothetical protein
MPLPTLQAAAGEGEVTGATASEDPAADLAALAEAGIDLDDVTDQLLRDGIEAFVVPMNKLLSGIRGQARGDRDRTARARSRPTCRRAGGPGRERSRRRERRTSCAASGARTARCGRRRARRARRTGSAG